MFGNLINIKMKALVGVKRVLDYSIKVRVNPQKTAVDL